MKKLGNVVFGPVPSRRLGRSLGINIIPPKTCSYSCVYCQLGRTTEMTIEKRAFYNPEKLTETVKWKVDKTLSRNESIDYLTFVPDGEPTLDSNLGREISLLKCTKIPIAVITNSSLIWDETVRENLLEANYISLKVDAVSENLWRKINKPHKSLKLNAILEGITELVEDFKGTISSETMLIDGIDYNNEFENIADYLKGLKKLDIAYIAAPTRPPTEKWVQPAKERVLNEAFQIFSNKIGTDKVEFLIDYEGNTFSSTGEVEEDLMSITAVHPMRQEAVKLFLQKENADWQIMSKLLRENKLLELEYKGKIYYMKKPRKDIIFSEKFEANELDNE